MKIPALLKASPSLMVEVTDVDEEVFALYTSLAGSTTRESWGPETDTSQTLAGGGDWRRRSTLGFLDSGAATLALRLDVRAPPGLRRVPSPEPPGVSSQERGRRRKLNKKKNKKQEGTEHSEGRTVQLQIKQDVFACAHRPGDTGSLVWRASVDLAELLWSELLFPSTMEQASRMEEASMEQEGSMFAMERLVSKPGSHVLELGAGTGCLAILCADMFPAQSCGSWTVSDQFDQLPMMVRNFAHNRVPLSTAPACDHAPNPSQSRHRVEEIDWLQVEQLWLKDQQRRAAAGMGPTLHQPISVHGTKRYDLILAVDCLYNEALVLPLLRTIDYHATAAGTMTTTTARMEMEEREEQGPTLVLLLTELRAPDVVRLFLQHWLALRNPTWSIFRIPIPCRLSHLNIASPHYAIWCGWKN